jgi:hypothetical protein
MPLISFCTLLLIGAQVAASQPNPEPGKTGAEKTGRQIPLADKAFASSSVNVVAGSRQTLFTDNAYQYAGFYDASGRLVLAKRRLLDNHWEVRPTAFGTKPEDAHNTVSLVVDGQGYLHLAWGHHNDPLNYSRSLKPGSLAMGEPRVMVGNAEGSVTYPQFFRRADGNLLFLYRDGGSGNGRLVLNHYDAERRKWTRLQDNLIDGEQQRSAYWDMTIDGRGHLHLAWNWRETPDVASNHDLLYARSDDGGRTWQRTDGSRYILPITQKNAEVAAAIPQQSNLMNPPFIAADQQGRPIIVSYWSPSKKDRPRYNLVYRNQNAWHTVVGPEAGEHFTLQGHGTKRPPISRAVLLWEPVENNARVHLIYRDDSKGGRVVVASNDGLRAPQWRFRYLTDSNVGGWEPSIDPEQWQQAEQAHLLLQTVGQVDGDDVGGSGAKPAPISVLIWDPSKTK